jgi:hypothetical protein
MVKTTSGHFKFEIVEDDGNLTFNVSTTDASPECTFAVGLIMEEDGNTYTTLSPRMCITPGEKLTMGCLIINKDVRGIGVFFTPDSKTTDLEFSRNSDGQFVQDKEC